MGGFYFISGLFLGFTIFGFWLHRSRIAPSLKRREAKHAVLIFRYEREHLEAKFLDLASRTGKPRDVWWSECQWQHDVSFGRNVDTGIITAFVALNISCEPLPGGDMEEYAAVTHQKFASAIFHYEHGHWSTGGQALFNLSPEKVLERLDGQYAPLELD